MPFVIPLGDLLVRLTGDSVIFQEMLTDAQKRMKSVASSLRTVGTRMTAAFTLPIAAIGGLSIKAASDAEETASKFNVVFSDVITNAREMAKVLDESYGLSSDSSKRLLSDTGDLLAGFGFTQDEALDLSNQVQKLAVDLASFTNFEGGAEGASRALTKGLLGEREAMKRLGIAINEKSPQYQAMLRSVEETTGKVGLQAKALATLRVAMLQSKNAIGDWGRTNESFANQMRELTSDINDMQVEIGKELLPFAKDAVAVFRDLLVSWREVSAEGKQVVLVVAGLVAVVGPLLLLLSGLASLGAGTVAFFVAGGGSALAMAAAIGVVVVAVTSLVDSLARLQGEQETGMLDMVESFEVGGTKISTRMQAVWLSIFNGWAVVKNNILIAWETLLVGISKIANELKQKLILAALDVANAWTTAVDIVTPFARSQQEFQAQLQANNDMFLGMLGNAKAEGLKIEKTFTQNVIDLEKELINERANNAAALNLQLDKDAQEAIARAEATAKKQVTVAKEAQKEIVKAKQGGPTLQQLGATEEQIKELTKGFVPEDLSRFLKQALDQYGPTLEQLGATKEQIKELTGKAKSPSEVSKTTFEQIELSRFALEGKGGLAQRNKEKQEVSNPVMEKLTQKLITETQKKTVAVLG